MFFSFISHPRDIVSINVLHVILKIINQCDVKPIMTYKKIKQKTSVLMIPIYTVTSISARPIGLHVMLVIVPVSTFRTDVIYLWNEPMSIIRNTVREMKIWIYWSESNSWIYFYIYLNKNWKTYCFEQSFTGLGPEDWCSSWEQT